ncbi:MAG TPA: RNase H-like domain-containing protein, partial [Aquella sp.]|nr:RNase H-like domain-containing protein [Aquella sp.]
MTIPFNPKLYAVNPQIRNFHNGNSSQVDLNTSGNKPKRKCKRNVKPTVNNHNPVDIDNTDQLIEEIVSGENLPLIDGITGVQPVLTDKHGRRFKWFGNRFSNPEESLNTRDAVDRLVEVDSESESEIFPFASIDLSENSQEIKKEKLAEPSVCVGTYIPPLVVDCKINNSILKVLIDSGSQVSLINERNKNILQDFENCYSDITTVNGEHVVLTGKGTLQFEILGEHISTKAVVMKNFQYDILLGLDILFDRPFLVAKAVEYVKSKTDSEFLSVLNLDKKCNWVTIDDEIVIPPRAIYTAKFKISNAIEFDKYLISPLSDMNQIEHNNDLDFVVPRCIVTIVDGKFSIPMHNFNNTECCLPKGIKIGVIEPYKEIIVASSSIKNHWLPDNWLENKTDLDPRVRSVLEKYRIRLNEGNYVSDLPKMFIDTGDNKPISRPPYKTTLENRKIIEEEINRLKELGYIQNSYGPWSAPCLLVFKKDINGKVDRSKPRLVADYTLINQITSPVVHYMSNSTEILEQLNGANLYSAIDLKESYHQIKMEESDIPKTAISTHLGNFEYQTANFGLKSAGSFLQKVLNIVLSGINGQYLAIFIDDILLYSNQSQTIETHISMLDETLQRLASHGFLINIDKSKFLKENIEFLGLELGKGSSTIAERNVKVVKDMKPPMNRKMLKSHLGFFSFYRRYIKSFSKRTQSMRDLANSEDRFNFDEKCLQEFEDMKQCLISKPILVHYNSKYPVILKTDASLRSLGAILSHVIDGKEFPIAYASRVLLKNERKWGIQDLEAYCVIWALEYFKFWLINHSDLTVVTDNHNLCFLQKKADKSGRYGRWLLRLNQFQAKLIHRKGENHGDVDCLSRLEANTVEGNPLNCLFVSDLTFSEAYEGDEEVKQLLKRKVIYFKDNKYWYKKRSGLHRQELVFVPAKLRRKLIETVHLDKTLGHPSYLKSYFKISQRYYWRSCLKDLKKFVSMCSICQKRNPKTTRNFGLMQTIPCNDVYQELCIDYIGPFQNCQSKKYILLASCNFSKYVVAIPTSDMTAITAAKFILYNIGLKFMFPQIIRSDRGSAFLSEV